MLPLGMVILWAGYGVASWGYVLNKGYDISLRQWFSPIHPWTGDISKAGPIPPGQIFPKGRSGPAQSQNKGAAGSNTATGQATQQQQKGKGATQQQQSGP